ncbi:MAG TPA: hypothetical protein VFC33_06085, partial [Acidimicrobiia bacterium]|nr:hypothetical protein [Acidimicrobiia bacterium]
MTSRAMRRTSVLVSSVVAAATLTSCTSSSRSTARAQSAPRAANPTVVVVGVVDAGDPVAGAAVTLRAANGAPIATAPSDTLASGAFAVEATDLPRDFRVIATGGTVDGRPLASPLAADVQ